MTLSLELNKVSKRFGEFIALKNLNATVEHGDRICVLGHNGAGKSTLLNLVAGLSKPTSGEIIYRENGQVLKDKHQRRGLLTYLSHEPMLYPDLTALENLRFICRLYGQPDDEASLRKWLEMVGMAGAAERIFRTCSRGMQQRLSLARALIPNPRLLLLDEPFSGLDSGGVERLIQLLEPGPYSWLLVTHDLRLGYQMANRFWIFRRGRLVHDLNKAGLDFEEYLSMSSISGAEVPT